jgi:hypothetical protein
MVNSGASRDGVANSAACGAVSLAGALLLAPLLLHHFIAAGKTARAAPSA